MLFVLEGDRFGCASPFLSTADGVAKFPSDAACVWRALDIIVALTGVIKVLSAIRSDADVVL